MRPRTPLILAAAALASTLLAAPARAVPGQPSAPATSEADASLAAAVERALLFDPVVWSHRLEVSSADGVVTLRGELHHLLARERALQLTEAVRGVRAVIDRMHLQIPAVADDELRLDVLGALTDDAATNSIAITASAEAGCVTLTGTVGSWAERQIAERVVKRVLGVRAVENELAIGHHVRPASELRDEILARLRWDAYVRAATLDVAVDAEGAVRLSGSVGHLAAKHRAEQACWIKGVRTVDASALQIQPALSDPRRRMAPVEHVDDADLALALASALKHDPRVAPHAIKANVAHGSVELTGVVDNLKARRAAAQDARNVIGVRKVINSIAVKHAGPADREVERQIHSAFRRSPFVSHDEVRASARQGVVTLTGSVDSLLEKSEADDVASRVRGVTEVVNRLEIDTVVLPQEFWPYASPDDYNPYYYDWWSIQPRPYVPSKESDETILSAIQAELASNPYITGLRVEVSVRAGVVRLSGHVNSWAQRQAASISAYEGGALQVHNELEVESHD